MSGRTLLRTAGSGLLASAALIAVVTALARITGFGRWLVFSRNVGAQCVGEAYGAANLLPNVLFEVVAGGALAAAVVPLLAGPLARAAAGSPAGGPRTDSGAGRDEADRIASALLSWAVLVLLPVSALLAALSGPLARVVVADQGCPGQQQLAARMLLVFAPQITLYGLGIVLTGVLQAHRRFFWPAVAPLLSSLVVIGAYLAFGATADGRQDAAATLPASAEAWLAWGTTAGVAAMTLPLLLPVRGAGIRLRWTLRFPDGVARRGRTLAGAGLSALLAQQASVLIGVRLATAADDTGAYQVFQYAQAVYLLPYAVLAVPLATSAFPRLADRAATGDRAGYAALSARSTRLVVAAALLGATGLVAAAPAIGAFFAVLDRGDVGDLGVALTVLAPALWGFALIAHLGRALAALQRAAAAARAAAAGWLVVAGASVLGVPEFGPVIGLAAGMTAGMTVAGVLLLAAIRRAAGPAALAGVLRTLAVAVAAGMLGAVAGRVPADAVLTGGAGGPGGPVSLGRSLAAGLVAVIVAAAVFAVLSLLDRRLLGELRARSQPVPPAEVPR